MGKINTKALQSASYSEAETPMKQYLNKDKARQEFESYKSMVSQTPQSSKMKPKKAERKNEDLNSVVDFRVSGYGSLGSQITKH